MPSVHPPDCGPLWLRQRTIGKANKRHMRTTRDLIKRLNREAILSGHNGCVNCLEWNSAGNILASGSDDSSIILWDTFRASKRKVIWPKHQGIVFSVKFMPASNDSILASCGNDCQVRVTSATNSESLLVCDSCHTDRIKRLAVHPSEPAMVWSAAEDGLIVQYDTRRPHTCNVQGNVLLDLNFDHGSLEAKCIAINPLRSEMLAVGTNDIYNRLFDRRFIKRDASISCTAYLTPAHLPQTKNRSNRVQSYGTTFLSFNSDGSQLLASVHAEQIYLYNTYEPNLGYRSFETSIKPLLLGAAAPVDKVAPLETQVGTQTIEPHERPVKDTASAYPQDWESIDLTDLSDDLRLEDFARLGVRAPWLLVEKMNEKLARESHCADALRTRAVGLIHRGWRGDLYEALRDCCQSLALDPLNFKTIRCLAKTLIALGYRDACVNLLEFVELLIEMNPNEQVLFDIQNKLAAYKRSPSPTGSSDDEMSCNWQPRELRRLEGLMSRLTGSRCNTTSFEQEHKRRLKTFDFKKRFCGHSNMNTDIKEANFFGANDEFIVGGSDDGAFYIWDKDTTNVVKAVHADDHIVNCVQPHPSICMLATSGIESSVKLWSLNGKVCRDVKNIDEYSILNNEYISTDPLDAMINMLRAAEEHN